ncbi:hypothetical protein BCR44DRAFT_1439386 [Catenaria anguillulae PL171]|uniref:Uncharacterized protein n=1 Tax=Catenaria anguillulae PL171 TaxID=765915 RepID=A0A1Y2HGL5_9FUNG|nr:hypothetical protein BCR44DRAFT_1439386 [Catenaria anguillulae PL171]
MTEDAMDVNGPASTTGPNASADGRGLVGRRASSPIPAPAAPTSATPDSRKRSTASRSPTRSSARLQAGSRAPSKDPVAAGRTRRSISHVAGLDEGGALADEQGQTLLGPGVDEQQAASSSRVAKTRASGRRAAAVANAAFAGDSPATSSLPDISAPDQSSGVGQAVAAHLDAVESDPTAAAASSIPHDIASPTLGTTGYNLEVVCRREPYMYFVASNYTEVTSRNLKKRTAADISAIHVDDRAGAIWVCFDIQRVYSEYDNLTMPCKQSLCSLFRRALDGPDGPDAGATIHGWAAITEEASEVVRKTGDMVLARDLNRKVVPRKTGYVMVLESAAASPVIPSGATTRRSRINSRSPSPEIITSYKRRRVSGERSVAANGNQDQRQGNSHLLSNHDSGLSSASTSAYHPYSRSSPPPRSINPPLDPTAAFVMPPDTSVDYTQVLANEFSATLKRVSADIHLKYTELRNICTALHAENNELRVANGGAPDTAIQELKAAKARIAKLEHENATLEAKVREQAATIDRVRKTLWAAGNKPDI